jgi:sulfhydrogenase subunit beta (sulfur reductase)
MTESFVFERKQFSRLLEALRQEGYRVLGPTRADKAILYDDLSSEADLPIGWTDQQEGGTYRLLRRGDQALFGYIVGPHSWKKFLHEPDLKFCLAHRGSNGFQMERVEAGSLPPLAFVGVHSCDLHAISIQDRVFLDEKYPDLAYRARRQDNFIVAANCGHACSTCFCVSMGTGPKASSGFDLALTEVIEGVRHYFVVEVGTERGGAILDKIEHQQAQKEEKEAAERAVARAVSEVGRVMDTTDIKDLLYRNYENPRWEEVASRCLSCGNCTMACPTCFCTTVVDATSLDRRNAERKRRWDSCFTMDFSYIHGGSIRASTKSRYRQWMVHKLAAWIDQFGTSGCVGCGRCITWCPVGIDITEEVKAIRDSEGKEEGKAPLSRKG